MRPWLRAESGQGLPVMGYVFRQEFESNKAVEPRVLGFVDDTHTTAAELFDDAVVRNGVAEH